MRGVVQGQGFCLPSATALEPEPGELLFAYITVCFPHLFMYLYATFGVLYLRHLPGKGEGEAVGGGLGDGFALLHPLVRSLVECHFTGLAKRYTHITHTHSLAYTHNTHTLTSTHILAHSHTYSYTRAHTPAGCLSCSVTCASSSPIAAGTSPTGYCESRVFKLKKEQMCNGCMVMSVCCNRKLLRKLCGLSSLLQAIYPGAHDQHVGNVCQLTIKLNQERQSWST